MRALFLLLLLANLLFAAWVHWVAPPRVTTAGRATPSATEANEIRLLREAQVSDGSADDALACVSAGPYLEQQLAAQAEARLQRLGFAVRLRESRENVRVGDWVRVEDLATPEDAANALAQLQAAGIPDAYVLTDEAPATVISLGVFTDAARAEQVSIIARMAGFEPRTIERLREADVFWLDIDRQASAGLPSLEQLGGDDPAQLPAVELRRCPEPEAATANP